jgi:hypothetical protein
MIDEYGGVEAFYKSFFINSVSPLGYVKRNDRGKYKNYNYYDSKELLEAVENFVLKSIDKIIQLGMETDICFCLGNNKNYKYLLSLNRKHNFFESIVALEHPRYIMQYKLKNKSYYIQKYLDILT